MKHRSFFSANKETLLTRYPHLTWIFNKSELQPYPVVAAKSGEPALQVDDCWVCSRYDPAKEALRFAKAQSIQPDDFIICYGFGMGYHLQALLNALEGDGFLYALELNVRLILTAMHTLDCQELINDPRFHLITGRDQTEAAEAVKHHALWGLDTISDTRKKVILHDPSFRLMPTQFPWFKNSLEILQFDRRGTASFQEEMQQNLIANLEVILTSPGCQSLESCLNPNGVMLVGAGPSLDTCWPLIKEYQSRAWVVCADTALIPLMEHGIHPDLVVSVDPQEKSIQNFTPYLDETFNLVILPTSASSVVSQVKGPKYIVIQEESFAQHFFEQHLNPLGLTKGGGAVSVIAADIVLQSTRGPVCLVGMDFSFPHMKSFASYTPTLNEWHAKTGPYYTLEMASIENVYSRKTVFIENYMDTPVPTFQSMYSYVRSLEAVISQYSRDNLYTVCPEGARVTGVTPLYFTEELGKVFQPPCIRTWPDTPSPLEPATSDFCREKIKKLINTPSSD